LDPKLIRAIVQVESAFDPTAISPKGAMGLMQLMPAVANQFRITDPYEPEQNLRGGTRYFRKLLDDFAGQVELALAGYNAGPAAVERFGGIPPYAETRDYVRKVLQVYWGESVDLSDFSVSRRTYLGRDPRGHLLLTTSAPTRR
jgi:soluble lytic murein transglycosylase